eukprot:scaffold269855_cov22-Tisochrysis_lutea.AAC.1
MAYWGYKSRSSLIPIPGREKQHKILRQRPWLPPYPKASWSFSFTSGSTMAPSKPAYNVALHMSAGHWSSSTLLYNSPPLTESIPEDFLQCDMFPPGNIERAAHR